MKKSPQQQTIEFVQKTGRRWQSLLHLDHWTIEFAVKHEHEFANDGALGECYHHSTDRRAVIYILHPDDWSSVGETFYKLSSGEIERVIIHELVHIILQDMAVKAPKRDTERTANHLSDVLYDLSQR